MISEDDAMLVYQAHNIVTGRFYIGKTTKTLARRIRQHYNDTSIGRITYFHKALRKYHPDAFKWDILGTASTLDELNQLERRWINLLRECGHKTYNMRDGGDGGSRPGAENPKYGTHLSDSQKEKISRTLKEYYATHSNPMQGKSGPLAPQFGKPRSEDVKRRLSEAHKGRKHPYHEGGKNPSARAVICMDTGERFETATHASHRYNTDLSTIIKCCKGKVKLARGKSYRYADTE